MEPMTKENAFEILKQVAYAHVGNRQTHLAIEQALQVIGALVSHQAKVAEDLNKESAKPAKTDIPVISEHKKK